MDGDSVDNLGSLYLQFQSAELARDGRKVLDPLRPSTLLQNFCLHKTNYR
jgi:hypothetical protein